jgi:hypothetical protein
MGCCSGRVIDLGEEHIRQIFLDEHFLINTYSYQRLSHLLKNNATVKDIIEKKKLEELINTLFYKNTEENRFAKYHQAFFNYVLAQLPESKVNVYHAMFYLYPVINHTEETSHDVLYDIFSNKNNKVLTWAAFEKEFHAYVLYCAHELTRIIHLQNEVENSVTNLDTKLAIKNLYEKTYTLVNVRKESDRLLDGFIKERTETTMVGATEFSEHYKAHPVFSYHYIRDEMLQRYPPK